MPSYTEILREERRFVILELLEKAAGPNGLTVGLIQSALNGVFHNVSRDIVMADTAWLEEQGLLHLAPLGRDMVASLTQHGAELGRGIGKYPGLRKPLDRY